MAVSESQAGLDRLDFVDLNWVVVLVVLNGAQFSVWMLAKSSCRSHLIASIESRLEGICYLTVIWKVWVHIWRLDAVRHSWSTLVCAICITLTKIPLAIHGSHLDGLLHVEVCWVHDWVILEIDHSWARLSDLLSVGVDSLGLKSVVRFNELAVYTWTENHFEATLLWLRQKAIVIVKGLSVTRVLGTCLNWTAAMYLWYDSLLLLQDHAPVETAALCLHGALALEASLAVIV